MILIPRKPKVMMGRSKDELSLILEARERERRAEGWLAVMVIVLTVGILIAVILTH